MKYIYLGATMLLASGILAIIIDWKLAVIIFLAVQGNAIVQGANDKLNKRESEYYESDFYDDDIYKR